MPITCPACGNEEDDGALYCGLCKTVLKRVRAPGRPAEAQRPPISAVAAGVAASPAAPAASASPAAAAASASPAAAAASVEHKRGPIWIVDIASQGQRLEVHRRLAGLGQLAGLALAGVGGVTLLGGFASLSIGTIVFGLVAGLGGASTIGLRFHVVLDGASRQVVESIRLFGKTSTREHTVGAGTQLALSSRRIGSRSGASMLTRAIVGSQNFRLSLEDVPGRVVLAELSNLPDIFGLAKRIEKLLGVSIRDEASWFMKMPLP